MRIASLSRELKSKGYISFNRVNKPVDLELKTIEQLEQKAVSFAEAILPPGISRDTFSIHKHQFMEKLNGTPLFLEACSFRNNNGGIISVVNIFETLTSVQILTIYLLKNTHRKELMDIVDDYAIEMEILEEGHNEEVRPHCFSPQPCSAVM